jgi:hypothetical protein
MRNYGAKRLKATILDMIDRRISACREAEERYTALENCRDGGFLGSVELASRSAATERSARMEAELIRRFVADLPASGEPALTSPASETP